MKPTSLFSAALLATCAALPAQAAATRTVLVELFTSQG